MLSRRLPQKAHPKSHEVLALSIVYTQQIGTQQYIASHQCGARRPIQVLSSRVARMTLKGTTTRMDLSV